MGSRSDDDYWNNKYAEVAECYDHPDTEQVYDDVGPSGWYCPACDEEDEIERIYKYG